MREGEIHTDAIANGPGYFYMASPYTHDNARVKDQRYRDAMIYSWLLFKNGINHFAPIVSCHNIAVELGLPTDFAFWEKFDTAFITGSSGLIICMMDGWRTSVGVQAERKIAAAHGKPVYLCSRDYEAPPNLTFFNLSNVTLEAPSDAENLELLKRI